MKILFLIPSLASGGAERQLVTLAKGLQASGHRVSVACFENGGVLEADLVQVAIPIHRLDQLRRRDFFLLVIRLIRLVRHERPDILHGYLNRANVWCGLLKPFFPHIKMVWGIRSSNSPLVFYGRLAPLVFQMARRLSPLADLIIYNSAAGQRYYAERGFARRRGLVIPNGIDTERFCPDLDARRRIRAEWGIRDNDILIGLVARLDPVKDHATFLRAAALLLVQIPTVRFVCIGGGAADYRSTLQALAETLGLREHLIWADERNDAPAVQAALDVATLTSVSEGFSNVVAEAMACGVPCVVTDVGDSALIVENTGIAVPPSNPDALAKGWATMIARIRNPEDKARIGADVRTRIVTEFSQTRLTQRTIEALQSLLKR